MPDSVITKIFHDIDEAIETTKSEYPVLIKDSKFLQKYLQIKQKYLQKHFGK